VATNGSIPEFGVDGGDANTSDGDDDEDNYASAKQLLKDLMPAPTKVDDYDDVEDIYDTIVRSKTRGSSVSSSPSPQEPGKRGLILNELRETERGYLDGLRTIEASYYSLMRLPHTMKNMLLTEDDLEVIYMNLTSLIPVHEEINARLNKGEDIGAVFSDTTEGFLQYARYCAHLPDSQCRLNELLRKKEFKAQLEQLRQMSPGRFDLKSMLCVPMQRVLKYPLLLKELLKCTPVGHPGLTSLRGAVAAVKDIAKYVNEFSRDTEMIKECADVEKSLKEYPFDYFGAGLVGFGRLMLDNELKLEKATEGEKPKPNFRVATFKRRNEVCWYWGTGLRGRISQER